MALSEETSTIKGALNHRIVNGGTLAGKDAGALSMKPAYPIPNSEVLLYPFTAQLEEILRLEEANASRRKWGIATKKTTSIGDPRLYQYVKLAQTDKYGRFQFTKVRPGALFADVSRLGRHLPWQQTGRRASTRGPLSALHGQAGIRVG